MGRSSWLLSFKVVSHFFFAGEGPPNVITGRSFLLGWEVSQSEKFFAWEFINLPSSPLGDYQGKGTIGWGEGSS